MYELHSSIYRSHSVSFGSSGYGASKHTITSLNSGVLLLLDSRQLITKYVYTSKWLPVHTQRTERTQYSQSQSQFTISPVISDGCFQCALTPSLMFSHSRLLCALWDVGAGVSQLFPHKSSLHSISIVQKYLIFVCTVLVLLWNYVNSFDMRRSFWIYTYHHHRQRRLHRHHHHHYRQYAVP